MINELRVVLTAWADRLADIIAPVPRHALMADLLAAAEADYDCATSRSGNTRTCPRTCPPVSSAAPYAAPPAGTPGSRSWMSPTSSTATA